MPLPIALKEKYLARFDELISVGEELGKNTKTIAGRVFSGGFVNPGRIRKEPDKQVVQWPDFVKWRTNCISLLSQVIFPEHPHHRLIDSFGRIKNTLEHLQWGIATLTGIRDDVERNLLGDLSLQVESQIAGDYMGQAERLLEEGQSGKFDHVPAAVLSGAVLEKALRSLCDRQQPQISTTKLNGEQKTLDPLITDLKKAGVYNEAKAKQLRAWAAIRNHAAHGEFDEFGRKDVEDMIRGIKNFLADYYNG